MKIWLKQFVIYYLPVIIWMLVIFWLSNRPKVVKLDNPSSDFIIGKTAHLTEYAVLSVLLFWAVCKNLIVNKINWGIPFLYTVFYAISDEVHQLFIPTRTGMARDVIIDAIGGVIGLWMLKIIVPKVRNKPTK